MNENLFAVAEAGIELAMYGAEVFKDGKVTAMEGFGFLPKLMAIPGILEKKEEIKKEWAERTTASMQDLNQRIQAKFSLPDNPRLEAKIEKSITVGIALLDAIDAFKEPEATTDGQI